MTKRLVVIGAGTGGLMVSNHVARQLSKEIEHGEASVTLVGDRDEYLYQPGLLYVAFGLMRPRELIRKVQGLLVPGVHFIHERAERIDPEGRYVLTSGGRRLDYDYLVVATGSDLDLDEIPGLKEGAHWFYTLDGALRLQDALQDFRGGHLVMAMGLPHKCPVAPLEFAFMFDEWARERGIRDKTDIIYTFPINRAHSIENVGIWAAEEFQKREITLETFFNMESVDPVKQEIASLEGSILNYDLLVVIPPHKGDRVGMESGLTDGGTWLSTDRHTLQVGQYDNIFVVGDAANLPVSKAGSVAHFEADGLAENLVNLQTGGRAVHRYDGRAFCFIEAGLDKATYVTFDYINPPTLTPPTQGVHWFKQAYNRIHWMNLKAII